MTDKPDSWRVGKEISLAVIVTIVVQLAGIVWFASSISTKFDNRIDTNTAAITRNFARISKSVDDIDSLERVVATQNVINGRLDVTLKNINRTLEVFSRRMEARND